MKFVFVTFDIQNIGGIKTWRDELEVGLDRIGVEHEEKWVDKSTDLEEIPDADMYIMTHPCPRDTKSQGHDRWWKSVYEHLSDHKVVPVFHDPYWDERYEWLTEVGHHLDMGVAVQDLVADSLESWPEPWKMVRHPLDTQKAELRHDKDDMIMSASMFKTWKNVDKLVRYAPDIDLDVIVHGQGIEYHYMSGEKRKDAYRAHDDPNHEWIWERAQDTEGFEYVGMTPLEELWDNYRRARFIADLSQSAQWPQVINYTQLEPMLTGCIPVMFTDMVNPIMEGRVLHTPRPDGIPEVVNNVDDDDLREMREDNREFVEETFACTKIAEQFVEIHDEIEDGDHVNYGSQDTFAAF